MEDQPIILAIESSCDDTGVAVLKGNKVLANVVATQLEHTDYGGVVPEIASRAHMENIFPTLLKALKIAQIDKKEIDAVAVTRGPGLMGALIVGVSFAKSLALSLGVPIIEVNHMQAHVAAHFIDTTPEFPFLCLTVSGGHTQLVVVKDYFDMEVIGQTIDDAAGEAFDKTGKMLGLPYPAGPVIDKRAKSGDPDFIQFSKPRIKEFDFSFSGLKTSILYTLQKKEKETPGFVNENIDNICASAQRTIIEILMDKLIKAAKEHQLKNIAIAGGVSANSGLRKALEEAAGKYKWNIMVPSFE